MTYIHIDKSKRILHRKDNIIWMATYMECIDTWHPGTVAFASMLTGKIDGYFSLHKLFVIKEFNSSNYSGTWYRRLIEKLSLVKGRPDNIINMCDYIRNT